MLVANTNNHQGSMNFAEGIIGDLAEAEAFERWRRIQTTSEADLGFTGSLDPSDARKLALLRAEILNVGMGASVIASFANAGESRLFPGLSTASVLALVPQHSTAFDGDIYELSGKAQFFAIVQLVQGLLARLSLAHSLSKAFAGRSGSPAEDSFCPLGVTADSWRRVCKAAIEAHRAIVEVMSSSGYVCPPTVEGNTLELLRSASFGGWPCISREGYLSIPGWAERRVERRAKVAMPAKVSFGPARFPAIVENATQTGLGITSSLAVKVDSEIVVHLPDGRNLVGIVRWENSGKLGVRLFEPLAPDDTLLLGETV